MAGRKRNPDNALVTHLKKMGCTFCPTCYAYMPPEHTVHFKVEDWHMSRYKIVGDVGYATLEEREAA